VPSHATNAEQAKEAMESQRPIRDRMMDIDWGGQQSGRQGQ